MIHSVSVESEDFKKYESGIRHYLAIKCDEQIRDEIKLNDYVAINEYWVKGSSGRSFLAEITDLDYNGCTDGYLILSLEPRMIVDCEWRDADACIVGNVEEPDED